MQPRGDAAVLMIVLARPELLDRRPNWGGGKLNHLAIALEPLAPNAIGDLVQAGTDLIQVRIPVLNTLLGAALLVAGAGLLRMRAWAWLLAMSIEAISLAIALRWYALGEPRFGPMALSSLIVLALSQREVRQAFIHDHPHVEPAHGHVLDEHHAPDQQAPDQHAAD